MLDTFIKLSQFVPALSSCRLAAISREREKLPETANFDSLGQTFIEYADPRDVPPLMDTWLGELNRTCRQVLCEAEAIDAYAHLHLGFVHIHPFWDGNGRMARLLANLPLLRSGHLPLVIDVSERKRYIDTLADYEIAVGQLDPRTGVWPRVELEGPLREFCRDAYRATRDLAAKAKALQEERSRRGPA
jgi:Fic family protein